MNSEISLSELFDRYLEDDLNIIDRQEFELHLAQDPVFANRFKLHKDVDSALMESDIMEFRQQLEIIEATNQGLLDAGPMEVSRYSEPVVDQAILEQDIIALRNQLNKIHATIIEEVDASELPGYSGIEEAILNQDAALLQTELVTFNEKRGVASTPEEVERIRLAAEIDRAIMQDDIMALREKLSLLGDKEESLQRMVPVKRNFITYVSSVAAVLVFLIAGTIFLSKYSNSNGTYSGMFSNYNTLSNSRGPALDADKIIVTAVNLYNEHNYKLAGSLFDGWFEKGATNQVLQVYAGHCALENGDPDKGIKYLESISSDEPAYIDAQWYLAGCYLKKEQKGLALVILEKLSTNENLKKYQYPVDKLIKKLHR